MSDRDNYRKAFDEINSSPEITMDMLMKRKQVRQRKTLKATVCTVAVFSFLFLGSNVITYAQSGEPWIAKVLNFKTGNGVEITVKDYAEEDPGVAISEVIIDTDDQKDYCYEKDGRIIFAFGDKETDITDQCSGDSYYKYEYTDESGYRHIIVAGGTVDEPGWAEYIIDENGTCTFNLMSDSLTVNAEEGSQAGRITVINKSGEETEDGDPSREVYVFEEDDPILTEPELPSWLEKAEKDLGIAD